MKILFFAGFLLAILSTTSADLTCQQCSNIATATAKFYNYQPVIDGAISFFNETLCENEVFFDGQKTNHTCGQTINNFWPELVKVIFDDQQDWFNVAAWCPELECSDSYMAATTELDCGECIDKMEEFNENFTNGVYIGKLLYGLLYKGFCDDVVKKTLFNTISADDCRQGMVEYIPRMMAYAVKQNLDTERDHGFICNLEKYAGCTA